MAKLNDVLAGLVDDPIDVNVNDEMPKERGGFTPPPQPTQGKDAILFQLPKSFATNWALVQTAKQGQRVALQFDDESPLLTYPEGIPVRARITNQTREVNGVQVCELAYLLAALGFRGELKTNKQFIDAMNQYEGEYFAAGVDWTGYCNPKNDIYMAGQGRIEGRSGCGHNYATNSYKKKDGTPVYAIPRNEDKTFKSTFECLNEKCPATINVQVRLRNFKAVPREEQ